MQANLIGVTDQGQRFSKMLFVSSSARDCEPFVATGVREQCLPLHQISITSPRVRRWIKEAQRQTVCQIWYWINAETVVVLPTAGSCFLSWGK